MVGALLDAEAADEFVNNLILSVRSLIPVEQLCAEVEKRNRWASRICRLRLPSTQPCPKGQNLGHACSLCLRQVRFPGGEGAQHVDMRGSKGPGQDSSQGTLWLDRQHVLPCTGHSRPACVDQMGS